MARLSAEQKAVILSKQADVQALYLVGQQIDADCAAAGNCLSDVEAKLKAATGLNRNGMNLLPDEIKNNPEYKAAKAELDRQFKRVQDFGSKTKEFHRAFQVIRRPERYAHVSV